MKIYDENGKLQKIKKNGKIVWQREDNVRRDKISDASKQVLLDAILNNNGEKFRRHVFEILTGQTVEEAQG